MPERRTTFTREEAHAYLGCSAYTLNRLVQSKLLEGTYFMLGKRRFFFKDKLDEWMSEGGELGAMVKKLS